MRRKHWNTVKLKAAAKGQWLDILTTMGIPADVLDGRHHGCPKCGGTDRFRFTSADEGSMICNQCGKCGDGIATVEWWFGIDFPKACEAIGKMVGVEAEDVRQPTGHAFDTHLSFLPWSNARARWLLERYAFTADAIAMVGGQLATYRTDYLCIALPIKGEHGQITGRLLIAANEKELPTWPDGPRGAITHVRRMLAPGSRSGMILPTGWEHATELWRVEGPTDMLALLSQPGRPSDASVVTTSAGASEKPKPWMVRMWRDKIARVIGDADTPGIRGATMWAVALQSRAAAVYLHELPYEVTESHGRDLRDWIGEGNDWRHLGELHEVTVGDGCQEGNAENSDEQDGSVVLASPKAKPSIRVAGDGLIREYWDPEYLAVRHLEFYESNRPGSRLAYHREGWLKYNGTTWKELAKADLECYVRDSINRVYREAFEAQRNLEESNRKPVRIIKGEVATTMQAIAAKCHVPHSVNLNRFWDFSTKTESERSYLRLENGILDIDAMLRNAELDEALIAHSPDWFSTVCLPYKLDLDATCPQWMEVLQTSVGDHELIDLMQEWAGYILTHSTDQQKMMILYGDGANGKSVVLAAMQAMLGRENCSTVPLESFSDDFSVIETHGKLLNVSPDSGEIGRNAEGVLKAFTSGDRMQMNRKNKSAISVEPTARLMISTNSRPRFADRSGGIWRRLLLVPMNATIPMDKRILGMDKLDWWERSGELPGILLWALGGLARLKRNGRFTTPEVSIAEMEDYRDELNPARQFIREYTLFDESEHADFGAIYDAYRKWCESAGCKPMSNVTFGREIKRSYPDSEKRQVTNHGWDGTKKRVWVYTSIQFNPDGNQ